MSDHLTEEEQIQAIKQWWQENKFLVIVPAVVMGLGYGSWSIYKSQKEQAAYAASEKYEQLLDAMQTTGIQPLTDQQIAEASAKAEELVSDHSGSAYADMANLILARFDVEQKNAAEAADHLKAVINGSGNDAIKSLAKIRLAKVLIEQQKYDEALGLVATASSDAYTAQYAEVRGDILYAQGNGEAAKTAYEEALSSLTPDQIGRRNIIDLKLNGAKTVFSQPTEVSEEVKVEEESKAAAEVVKGDS